MQNTNPEALTIPLEHLKRELPIPYVLAHYGHFPVSEGDGRLHYKNPWRNDDNPSLDIFVNDEGVQRMGDFASGMQGSVIDLIQNENPSLEFPDILKEARSLYATYLEEGWDGPVVRAGDTPASMDSALVQEIMDSKITSGQSAVVLELMADNPSIDMATLQAFGARDYRGRLALPYPDGRAIRFRMQDGKTFLAGSKPGLYHHPDEDLEEATRVLLVEGESDTHAAWPLFDGMVVGIPGAGHQPSKHMEKFQDKNVTIAFDGDTAGRSATMKWADSLRSVGCEVSSIPVPDGTDLASHTTSALVTLLSMERQLPVNNSGMMATPEGYALPGGKDGEFRTLSNWTLEPLRVVEFDDETPRSFIVKVRASGATSGRTYQLGFDDMSSSTKLHKWASQFSGSWWGSGVDHQKFRAVIEEQSAFLPIERTTSTVGLVDGSFVTPVGVIGGGNTLCLPGAEYPWSDVAMYEGFGHTEPTASPVHTIMRLLGMHEPTVMQPILAWMAIAPLRSLYRQFPPLFVTGRAGSGKTTLISETLSVFGGPHLTANLTSTTPYALSLMLAVNNSFVLWLDEYRPGARKSTTEMMNQSLRDAYNNAVSHRAGLGSSPFAVTKVATGTPLLVSGEDFADEQSHRDRLVKVFVPRDGKGVLPRWSEVDYMLSNDYLLWLTERRDQGLGPSRAEVAPEIGDDFPDLDATERQRYNFSVLNAGWRLLRTYVLERSQVDIGQADWSSLTDVAAEEATEDPMMEALQSLWELHGTERGLWYDDEEDILYVSSSYAVSEMHKLGIPLPVTSARAFSLYLTQNLGGFLVRKAGPLTGGHQVRYVALARPWG